MSELDREKTKAKLLATIEAIGADASPDDDGAHMFADEVQAVLDALEAAKTDAEIIQIADDLSLKIIFKSLEFTD